ncbi:MAG TPA: ABC transporter permease [Pyrinomonadaceae bacterium]|jgi:putative ABC transport system permease protein
MPLWRWLSTLSRNIFHKARVDEELDEEVRAYLELLTDEKSAQGLDAEQARRASVLEVGGIEQVKEQVRDVRIGATMESLLQDLRYGVRVLIKNPGFTAVAVLTLALGVGANTAIFSVINAVLLRPLPYPEAQRLVWVWETHPNIKEEPASLPNFTDWKSQSQSFEGMAGLANASLALTGEGEPERIPTCFVVGDLFTVLGVSPALGRSFLAEEDKPGNERVVVLSYAIWQRRFGGDQNIVSKSITLSGNPYTVIGVLPQGFKHPQTGQRKEPELYAPLGRAPESAGRRSDFLGVLARTKPGVPLKQAQAEMNTITARLAQQYPDSNANWGVTLLPLHERVTGDVSRALWLLMGVVGFLLLIACVNVANLTLARSAARGQEIAVRRALGADRSRLVRQFLTESVLLSFIGGTLGLLLAAWGIAALSALSPGNIPRLDEVTLNWPVLAFTLAASLMTGLIFGLFPALNATNPNLTESLKEGGRSSTEGSRSARVRRGLVVFEIAVALMLLVGAGLMIRSFTHLQDVDPGFQPERVVAVDVGLPSAKYKEDERVVGFYDQFFGRVKAQTGVESVAAISTLPLSGSGDIITFQVDGQAEPGGDASADAEYRIISPGYFSTMSIPLVKGNDFTERDTKDAPYVMLVNETFARRFFPNEDAIGKRLNPSASSDAPWRTIVGIVKDVRLQSLDTEPYPQMYAPLAQSPRRSMTMVVRTAGDPMNVLPFVRNELKTLDKDQPLYNVRTMEQVLAESIARRRFNMMLIAIFAFLGLVLASVGIYGVISYSVTQRTHEIGIRMALGAEARDILKMIVKQGMGMVLLGIGLGLGGAFALTRVMSSLLFGVSPTDLTTFAGVPLILAMVALLACYIPARRATRVDPMIALRFE